MGLGNPRWILQQRQRKDKEMRFGTWNIKSLNGKKVVIVREMEKYRLELLGLSEVKKKGSGEKRLEKGFILRYSGVPAINRAKEGVGVIVSDELDKRVIIWNPVSSRIITLEFVLEEEKITLIQVYAPTEDAIAQEKEQFFDELKREVDITEEKERKVLLMGDLNVRVGNDYVTRNSGVVWRSCEEWKRAKNY
jgi:exonuclease III